MKLSKLKIQGVKTRSAQTNFIQERKHLSQLHLQYYTVMKKCSSFQGDRYITLKIFVSESQCPDSNSK